MATTKKTKTTGKTKKEAAEQPEVGARLCLAPAIMTGSTCRNNQDCLESQ